MAGIKVGLSFERTGAFAIDEAMVLTKAQMLAIDDSKMPDTYFAVCTEDSKFYIYDKNATPNAETGKFSLYAGSGEYDDTAVKSRLSALENSTADMYTKSEVEGKIAEELGKYDKLDYKKADSVPTATKVVIDGVEVDVVEGVRYLVKDSESNKFIEYVVLQGVVYNFGESNSAAAAVLSNELTVTNPIGKYPKDAVIPKDEALETVLRGILSKTYNPTLTPPKAVLPFNMPALKKVGDTITGGAVTATFDRGSINPQYTSESEYRAGEATGYEILLKNADNTYTDTNTTGEFTVPDIVKTSKGTVELEVTINHAAGVQPKNSDGGNFDEPLAAGSVTAKKSTQFILPFYYGASANPTVTDFTGLTEDLSLKSNKEYRITTAVSHPTIAYDSAHGDLTSILDQNGFETIGGWTKSVITVDGQSYAVYVHNNATTDTDAKYTFKF